MVCAGHGPAQGGRAGPPRHHGHAQPRACRDLRVDSLGHHRFQGGHRGSVQGIPGERPEEGHRRGEKRR